MALLPMLQPVSQQIILKLPVAQVVAHQHSSFNSTFQGTLSSQNLGTGFLGGCKRSPPLFIQPLLPIHVKNCSLFWASLTSSVQQEHAGPPPSSKPSLICSYFIWNTGFSLCPFAMPSHPVESGNESGTGGGGKENYCVWKGRLQLIRSSW